MEIPSLAGITGKIASNADKLGGLVAVFAGSDAGINDLLSSVQQVMAGQIHVPNIQTMQHYAGTYLPKAALAYIAGEIIDATDLPIIGKFGKAISKAAVGYGLVSAGIHLFWAATHSELVGENVLNGNRNNGSIGNRGY